MPYDYSKLLGRITEKYGSQAKFATALELSERSLSLKLNGKTGFRQQEIDKACELLDVSKTDIPMYFFALKVQ